MPCLSHLQNDIATFRVHAQSLIEASLDKIEDKSGQGPATFVAVHADHARAAAIAADQLRKQGVPLPPLAGLPISIKDLFDEQGQETLSGSVAAKGEGPASQDATVVAALRCAGAVIIGRTNMSEFAYSGLGLNPHYGTPLSPWDRQIGHIAGGSSSGAAVSVSDGMAAAALGTDTGGSIRIPAALCGLTGFKPTALRISREGVYPLSTSLDSVGSIASCVADCAMLDHVISQAPGNPRDLVARPVKGSRFAVPITLVLDSMDETVAEGFTRALTTLSEAGAVIEDISLPAFTDIAKLTLNGGICAAEAHAVHRRRLASKADAYDPRVLSRLKSGSRLSASDYIDLLTARRHLQQIVDQQTNSFDALLMPTVPMVAPPLAPLERDDITYTATNLLMLRNTSLFNFLDRCAFSLPCHRPGEAPVGLMVVGETMGDPSLMQVAAGIEACLRPLHTKILQA